MLAFDFLEDLGAAQPSEPDFPGEGPFQTGGKGFARAKQVPRPLHLIAEAVAEVGSGLAGKEVGLGHVEAAEIDLWDVDAVLAKVDGNVLPEVGELEGGADGVGKLGELLFAMAVEKEYQAANRVGTAAAVVEDGGEVLVAALDDVLFEGAEEIEKEGVGQVELRLGAEQGGEDPFVLGVVRLIGEGVLPGLPVVAENGETLS